MASSNPDKSNTPAASKTRSDFKEKLDEVAQQSRQDAQEARPNPIVEKIVEYVPAASKVLGGGGSDREQQEAAQAPGDSDIPGPPNRPDHDDKIEEFVRDQYRSGKETGVPVADAD